MNGEMITTDRLIPFSYVVLATVAASGTLTVPLQLQNDSYFEHEITLATSSLDVDTEFAPNNFSVKITDTGTGRDLSNLAVPQVLMAAVARFAPLHKRSIIYPPKANLQFVFTNLVASENTVTLVLQGYKMLQGFPGLKW